MLISRREQDDPIRGLSLVSEGVSRPSSSLPRTPPQPQGHRVGQGERMAAVHSQLPQTSWFLSVLCNRIVALILLCSLLQIMNAVIMSFFSLSQSNHQQSVFTDHNPLNGEPLQSSLKTMNLPSSNPSMTFGGHSL